MTVELKPAEAHQPPPQDNLWQPNRRRSAAILWLVKAVCFLCAAISILTTFGIVFILLEETVRFFADVYFTKTLLLEGLSEGISASVTETLSGLFDTAIALNPAELQAELIDLVEDQIEDLDRSELQQWATDLGVALPNLLQSMAYAVGRFFTDTSWTPLFNNANFGIFVLISATLLTSSIATLVALPLGLCIAIALSEYASPRLRSVLKPVLEVLAGIPSVVFGYFALLTVTPFMQTFIPPLEGFNALSAGLVLGVSITPLVASLSEDAIYAVPQDLRNGAYALGATKREVVLAVVIPAALSGIVASIILAISRAVGETMIVSLAAGQNPQPINADLDFINPFIPVMTMTSYIVQVSLGEAAFGTIAYKTLFAVGTTLFTMTLGLNIASYWFVRRFREKYE